MSKIIKKLIFLAASLIIFAAFQCTAYAGETDYTINKDGVLEKYTGGDTLVIVPNTVKMIGDYAFSGCSSIEEIVIPEGVTEIGDGAFYNCKSLKKLTFPSTLTTIGDSVFYECNSLKEVTIPKAVTRWSMHDSEESYTDGIEEYRVDPENSVYLSLDGVVYNKDMTVLLYYPRNRKNETYTFPDSVLDISKADFRGAKYLKQINFNSKVNLKNRSYLFVLFFLNGSLERFTVPDENETFCDIDGVLFTKDRKTLLAYPENKPGEQYRIPEGTETIDGRAFNTYTRTRDKLELKYILFPSSIKTVESGAAYAIAYDDSYPNRDFTFFGEKKSAAEAYAKEKGIPFSSYDPLKKGAQLLLTASELSLTPKKTAKLAPVFLSSATTQAITWKSSNPSVVSVDKEGELSAKKLGTAVISATTETGLKATCQVIVKLPAPQDLKIISGATSGKVFSWKKVPGAKSYTLYRTSECVNFYGALNGDLSALREPITKLGTTTGTNFTDRTLKKGSDYYYIVTANHASSQYNSDYSLPCYIYFPATVKKVTLTQGDHSVNIDWTIVSYPDRLIIYRATSKYGKYKIITETENYNERFTDTSVKSGTTYYYKIQIYCNPDGVKIYSGYTEPVSIKVK